MPARNFKTTPEQPVQNPAFSNLDEAASTFKSAEALSTGLYSYYPETQSVGMESSMRRRGGYLDHKRNSLPHILGTDTGFVAVPKLQQLPPNPIPEPGTIDPVSEMIAGQKSEPTLAAEPVPTPMPSSIDATLESIIAPASERIVVPNSPEELASESNIDPASESRKISPGPKTSELLILPRYEFASKDRDAKALEHEAWREDRYLNHGHDYPHHKPNHEFEDGMKLDTDRDWAEIDEKENTGQIKSREVSKTDDLYALQGIDSLPHLQPQDFADPQQQQHLHPSPLPVLTIPSPPLSTPESALYVAPHQTTFLSHLLWLSIFCIIFITRSLYRNCIARRRQNRTYSDTRRSQEKDEEESLVQRDERGAWDVAEMTADSPSMGTSTPATEAAV